MVKMAKVNVTPNLDPRLVEQVRKQFNGDLSKGINTSSSRELKKMETENSGFGLLKGEGPALKKALQKLRDEEHLD